MTKSTRTALQREQYAVADADDVPVIKGAIVKAEENRRITAWLRAREGQTVHPWRRRKA